MCNKCFLDLERAFELRQLIIKAEVQYFRPKREEFNKANLPLELEIKSEHSEDDEMTDIEVTDANEDSNVLQAIQPKTSEKRKKLKGPVCQIAPLDKKKLRSQIKIAHGSKSHNSEASNKETSKPRFVEDRQKNSQSTKMNQASRATVGTQKSKKKFKCSNCNKILSNSYTLRYHIKVVHEKLKRFACDICSVKFYEKTNLRRHLMCHVKNPNYKPKPRDTSDSTRAFKCDHKGCGKFFMIEKNLKSHIRKAHSGKNLSVNNCYNKT